MVSALGAAHGLDHLQVLTAKSVEVFGDMHALVLDGRGRVILDSTPAGAPSLADRSKEPLYAAVPVGKASLRDGKGEGGEPVRAALARIHELGLDWTVSVVRPTKWIEEQANRAKTSTFIAIAAALLLGIFLWGVVQVVAETAPACRDLRGTSRRTSVEYGRCTCDSSTAQS